MDSRLAVEAAVAEAVEPGVGELFAELAAGTEELGVLRQAAGTEAVLPLHPLLDRGSEARVVED